MNNKVSIYSLTLEELTNKIVSLGLKKHNGVQIYQWIYQKHVNSFLEMSNISKKAIPLLNEHFYFDNIKLIDKLVDANDETTKFLLELEDKQRIETVLMKFDYGYSVCISTQVGCNMGCKFCASGLLKKIRNLQPNEIIMQFMFAQKYLLEKNKDVINNIVIMGIGEPFDNYDNLKIALNIFNNHYGLGIGNRHITVSTCGLVDKIISFANDFNQVNLAISLHAPNDKIRNQIMPINKAYNIEKLINTIKQYLKITNRRISFEYILLKGINDSDDNALELAKLLHNMLCYVNIIVYNSVDENQFKPSDRALPFMKILKDHNVMATKRLERGNRINAACGQLRAKNQK